MSECWEAPLDTLRVTSSQLQIENDEGRPMRVSEVLEVARSSRTLAKIEAMMALEFLARFGTRLGASRIANDLSRKQDVHGPCGTLMTLTPQDDEGVRFIGKPIAVVNSEGNGRSDEAC